MICPECKTEMWQSSADRVSSGQPNPFICSKCGLAIPSGENQEVLNGLPGGPLMIFCETRISPEHMRHIIDQVGRTLEQGRIVLFDPGLTIYQIRNGVWWKIHNPDA